MSLTIFVQTDGDRSFVKNLDLLKKDAPLKIRIIRFFHLLCDTHVVFTRKAAVTFDLRRKNCRYPQNARSVLTRRKNRVHRRATDGLSFCPVERAIVILASGPILTSRLTKSRHSSAALTDFSAHASFLFRNY